MSSSSASNQQNVTLAVYDLSAGMAAQLSEVFIGRRVEGVWHTGIRVFGREFYFGEGIYNDAAGATPFGVPTRVDVLGTTPKSRVDFDNFLQSSEMTARFGPTAYHLLDNNCNHFTDACAKFLVNTGIDSSIVNLPDVIKGTPLAAMFTPAIDAMQRARQSRGQPFQSNRLSTTPTTTNNTVNDNGNALQPNMGGNFGRYRRQLALNPVVLTGGNKSVIEQRIRQSVPNTSTFTTDQLVSIACSDKHSDVAFAALDLLRVRAASLASPNSSDDGGGIKSSQLINLIQRHIIDSCEAIGNDEDGNSKHDVRAILTCVRLCVNTANLIDDAVISDILEYTTVATDWRIFRAGVVLLRNLACASKEHDEDRRIRILFFAYEGLHRLKRTSTESDFHANINAKDVTLVTTPLLQSLAATVDCDDNDNAAEWDILSVYGFNVEEYAKNADLKKDDEAKKAIDMLIRLRCSAPAE